MSFTPLDEVKKRVTCIGMSKSYHLFSSTFVNLFLVCLGIVQ